MSEQQAVTEETDPQLNTVEEGAGEQDDLDNLLNEYEGEQTAQSEPEQKESEPKGLTPEEAEEWRAERQERIMQRTNEDISSAAKSIIKDSELALPEIAVEGLLYREAMNDQRVARAFQNRSVNPDGWTKVLKGLGRKFAKDAKSPDAPATADRKAVEAAMRTTSKQPADDGDISSKINSMSRSEFQNYLDRLG